LGRNIYPAILGTVFCFLSTIISINHLSPYIITSLDKVGFIVSKLWYVLTNDYPGKYPPVCKVDF